MKELKEFEISEFGKPKTAGLYAVWCRNWFYDKGEFHLLYIGSANNLYGRLSNRKHPYLIAFNKLFDKMVWVSFIECNSNLRQNEKYLIQKHQPILNKQWR
jgi:excinuclease UvrABC nuclease subunit